MPRILFVTQHPPYPPRSGDRQRSFLLATALAEAGELSTILVGPGKSFYAEQLEVTRQRFGLIDKIDLPPAGSRGVWKVIRPLRPGLVDRIAVGMLRKSAAYRADPRVAGKVAEHVRKGEFDLVVGRFLRPAAIAGIPDLPPCILDVDDLETQVYTSRLASGRLSWPERIVTRWHLNQLQKIVPPLLGKFDHLWIPAPNDLAMIEHPSISVLPNIPFDENPGQLLSPLPAERASKMALIVATLKFPMNLSGVDRFIRQVWPSVKTAVPDAVLRICGSGLTAALKQKWSVFAGVEPIGFAENLREQYRQCAFAVAPIYEGGGTKIKIIEALNFGRVPLVYEHALHGYEHALKHGESVYVGANDGELAQGCIELFNDPSLRDRLGAAGAAIARTQFSYAGFAGEVKRTVEQVLGRRSVV